MDVPWILPSSAPLNKPRPAPARLHARRLERRLFQQRLATACLERSLRTYNRCLGEAEGELEDAAAQGVTRLHPALIKFLNSGYLVSQRELRQRLMWREQRVRDRACGACSTSRPPRAWSPHAIRRA